MTTIGPPSGSLFGQTDNDVPLDGPRGGVTFDEAKDGPRLNAQHRRVYSAMCEGGWRTLREIADETGDPEASVSARLRDFRKSEYGAYEVKRRRRTGGGTWEYRLVIGEGGER